MKRVGTSVRIEIDSPASVRLVLGAMLASLLLFTCVAGFLARGGPLGDSSLVQPFRVVLVALGLGLWLGARQASRLFVARGGDDSDSARRRLVGIVLRAAFAEAFGLLGSAFTLLTGDFYFLAAPVIAAALLLHLLPRQGGRPGNPGAGPSSRSHPIEP